MPTEEKSLKKRLLLDLLMMVMALLSAGLLVYELSVELVAEQLWYVHLIDLGIALFFLGEFLFMLARAEDRRGYFRSHWYDLVAAIPVTGGTFQSLRLVRLFRVIRVLRVLVRLNILARLSEEITDRGAKYIYVMLASIMGLLSGSAAFYRVENVANDSVNNYFDAVWWTMLTVTTVGYGDIVPVTWQGRVVAMTMMVFGISLLGTLAGFVGSEVLSHYRKRSWW